MTMINLTINFVPELHVSFMVHVSRIIHGFTRNKAAIYCCQQDYLSEMARAQETGICK